MTTAKSNIERHANALLVGLSRKLAFLAALSAMLYLVWLAGTRTDWLGPYLKRVDLPALSGWDASGAQPDGSQHDTQTIAPGNPKDVADKSTIESASSLSVLPQPTIAGDITSVKLIPTELSNSISVERMYTGVIKPSQATELAFKTTGKLVELMVDEGDTVEKGDLLALLDTQLLEAERAVIEAELKATQATYDELVAGPRQQTIRAARAKLDQLRALAELGEITAERRLRLANSDAGSRQDADNARLQARASESELAAQQEVVSELEAGTRKERIAAEAARIEQLHASLDRLDVLMNESRLYAPYDAVVSSRLTDEGAIVSPGQNVLRVVSRNEKEAWIGLPPEVAAGMQPGELVNLSLGDLELRGELKALLPELNTTTRTQTAIFSLQGDAHTAPFGQIVRLACDQERDSAGFWLPTSSLTHGYRGLWAVYVAIPLTDDEVAEPADSELDNQILSDDRSSMQLNSDLTDFSDARYKVEEGNASESHDKQPSHGTPAPLSMRPTFLIERRDVEVLEIMSEKVLVRGTLLPGDLVVESGVQKIVPGQIVCSAVDAE